MINKESQKKQLVKGIIALGADFACKYGARGHSVAKVFSKYCDTGAKRIWDLSQEWESFLIKNNTPSLTNYLDILPAYKYNRKTKHYILNRYFFYWLKDYYFSNNYLKGVKNEESVL